MITEILGDALAHPQGLIVHGCNCQGVMGSGIALTVKQRYPSVYEAYKLAEANSGLHLGDIIPVVVGPRKWIVNAMTQHLYGGGRNVNYEAIARCFENLGAFAKTEMMNGELPDIVFPLIGADRGGGNWKIISTIIDETLPDSVGFKKILYRFPG